MRVKTHITDALYHFFPFIQPEGVFLEWHALEEEYYVKGTSEAEWTVVESVTYKNDKEQSKLR